MFEMAARKRDYKKEYAATHGTKEGKLRRAARNRARRKAMKNGTVKKGDGKEVHHVRPLAVTGAKKASGTRVVSKKTNRKSQPKRKGNTKKQR